MLSLTLTLTLSVSLSLTISSSSRDESAESTHSAVALLLGVADAAIVIRFFFYEVLTPGPTFARACGRSLLSCRASSVVVRVGYFYFYDKE